MYTQQKPWMETSEVTTKCTKCSQASCIETSKKM